VPRLKSHPITDPIAFGKRLRTARAAAGISQRELAKAAKTSAGYISRIETGDRVPALHVVQAIAERLGVSAEFLVSGSELPALEQRLLDADLALRLDDTTTASEIYSDLRERDLPPQLRTSVVVGLGLIAFRSERLEEAIELLREATSLASPARTDAVETLGRALAMTGRFEEAIAVLMDAVREAEARDAYADRLRFAVLLANALIDAGRFGAAEEVLAPVVVEDGLPADAFGRARIYWTQSRLHTMQGDHDLAAAYARQALELLVDSENVLYQSRAYQTLAHIELERGQAAEGLALLERAEELLTPTDGRFDRGKLMLEKARALLALGDREAAATLAQDAVAVLEDLEPHDRGRAFVVLGRIFTEIGESERALEIFELAEELLSGAPSRYLIELYEHMASILERGGEHQRALEVLRRAVKAQTSWHRPDVSA
jgi:tetratricopeptide (TPR) repeat protein